MSEKKVKWKEERIYWMLGFLGCLGMILYACLFKSSEQTDLYKADLITFNNLILKASLVLEKVKSKKHIDLEFQDYKNKFRIGEYDVNPVSEVQILKEIKAGDTLSVGMTESEYKNINKDGFFDHVVEINSLQKEGKEFLNLKFRNFRVYRATWDVVPSLIYVAIMCIYFTSLSKRPKYSPTLIVVIGGFIIMYIKIIWF